MGSFPGHLQLVIQVVQNHHAGEQGTQWDKTTKRVTPFKMVISFVCLVLVCPLLSSMAVLYHMNNQQDATEVAYTSASGLWN